MGVEELEGELEKSWTYLDMLAVSVALMKATRVRAKDWHVALYEIRESLNPQERELFDDIHFDTMLIDFGIIYSEQVEAFLGTMRRSDCMSILGPHYRKMLIEKDTKRQLLEGNPVLLEQHRETLQKIADMLDEKLAITKKSS